MENVDRRKAIQGTIEKIQKDLFDTAENNFILLYQYDTGKVTIFFNRVARLFGLDFSNGRPTTMNELINMIVENMDKNWWK
jgi:stage III sporulation protein SpoIIIAA